MEIQEFIVNTLEDHGIDDVDCVALTGPSGPGHIMGVVFEVGGQWMHATDYYDGEPRWDGKRSDYVVLWEKPSS